MLTKDLLLAFVQAYGAQPATALWRAIETRAVLSSGLPDGLGLDLGCGDGLLTDILLRYGGVRQLVGVDLDPAETSAASRFHFYSRVHTASSDQIPEAGGTFDFVLANSVLEHIPNLDGTLSEVGRVLRPGGEFLFTVPGPAFHGNLRPRRDASRSAARFEALDRRLAHLRYLSAEEWVTRCARHRLEVTTSHSYLTQSETRRWEVASELTGGLLYRLGGSKASPLAIQRRIGLRTLQNRRPLPMVLARPLAALLGAGLALAEPPLAPDHSGSCLLIRGVRLG